jgi:hypothetical protein
MRWPSLALVLIAWPLAAQNLENCDCTHFPVHPRGCEIVCDKRGDVDRQFVGFWLYDKASAVQRSKSKDFYPPEYVETTVTDDGHVIHGTYTSRYQVVGRAISPDVNFTFTGTALNGSQLSCQWIGEEGAKGDLTLTPISENSIRLDWIASTFGRHQGLGSGTAILSRRRSQFGGVWFYAKPAVVHQNKTIALYPPDFIEANLVENDGVIRGRYTSRYQVVGRAISPDVNFTFTGTLLNGSQLTCPWTGEEGAQGNLTLTLVSENSMRLDWIARTLGRHQGLSSGTAVLSRVPAPPP